MKCSDCGEEANTRVRVNGKPSVVCESHRVAIVKRIEQVTRLFGRSNPNLQKMLLMTLGEIEFEDLRHAGQGALARRRAVDSAAGGEMNRREFLTSTVAAVAASAAPSGVPCDCWTSGEGNCTRAAVFKYADPSANRAPRPVGPRNFCKEHIGCATLSLVAIQGAK